MKKSVILFVALLSLFVTSPSLNGQTKLKPEEIVAKHLASIAPPEKLASIKSLIAVGEVRVEYLTQKNQPASGRIVIASEGDKMFFGMQLNAADYPQEKVIFDGNKVDVAAVRAGTRSVFGNFLQSNSSIISQGILAGVYTTSWPFLGTERGYKISSGGTKKIDEKDAYAIKFSPKGSSDVDITMYFNEQTFQHVRTEYKRTSSASMGRTIDESARQHETRLKVTEDFSDYRVFEGINVPSKYRIHYSISGQNGTTEISWTASFSEFALNQPLDPGTFAISK